MWRGSSRTRNLSPVLLAPEPFLLITVIYECLVCAKHSADCSACIISLAFLLPLLRTVSLLVALTHKKALCRVASVLPEAAVFGPPDTAWNFFVARSHHQHPRPTLLPSPHCFLSLVSTEMVVILPNPWSSSLVLPLATPPPLHQTPTHSSICTLPPPHQKST